MAWLACPYLNTPVELTAERERHIAESHPDLLPEHRPAVDLALAAPDQVRTSSRLAGAHLFARWFDDIRNGKHVVVVVVSDPPPSGRARVITAYLARRLSGGTIVWSRS